MTSSTALSSGNLEEVLFFFFDAEHLEKLIYLVGFVGYQLYHAGSSLHHSGVAVTHRLSS